jgi:glutamyl-tRNA synthetase
VAKRIEALGVPAELADSFWRVAKDNITVLSDLDGWWALFRDGAEPLIAPEDAEFIAQAMALLPPMPFGPNAWADWTASVKAKTGRKGKALFMPLRKALTGQAHGPEMADVMPLMQVVRAKP